MFVAKVTGNVVATQKVKSMTGCKLLVVEPYRVDEASKDRLVATGRTFVVVDTLGAEPGAVVTWVRCSIPLVTRASSNG